MSRNCLGERSGQPVKYFFFSSDFDFGDENYVFLVTSYQECFQWKSVGGLGSTGNYGSL